MVILSPVKLTMKTNHPVSPKRRMSLNKHVFSDRLGKVPPCHRHAPRRERGQRGEDL